MTLRGGTGEIKEDGGTMGHPRPRSGNLSSALDTTFVCLINPGGLLKAYQSSSSTVLATVLGKDIDCSTLSARY
jgi:hypothetical protein